MLYFFMFFSRKKSKSRKKGEKSEDTMFLQFSGESKNIEYKVSLFDKSEKYMKTIVAFANIFSQMGLVEAWGSGIKRILNAAEEYGLPKPRFQEFDNMFRVELFRVNPITDQANQATNQANQDLERLDQVEDENVLSEKEIEILNLVRMQPSITQKEMANALDWNLASVKYYITKLKEKNYLKRQGSSQKGKWVILTKRD